MKKGFNILIVEDELMIAEMTKDMLMIIGYSVLGVANNYQTALQFLSNPSEIDMVILDINLNDSKNGIDIGKQIKEEYRIPFIYLTSYSDPSTIKEAALTTPAAYLLKPFTKSDLYTTIELIKARKHQHNETVIVKEDGLNIKIESKYITYVKSDNNYIEIHTTSKKYTQRVSLDKFLENISDSNFIRVHRSYLVNIINIDAINGQYVYIGAEKIPMSRTYKEEVLELFLDQ